MSLAVLGNEADAGAHRFRGRAYLPLRAVEEDRAAVESVGAEDHPRDLAAARSDEAAKAHDLARAHGEADVAHEASGVQIADDEPLLADLALALFGEQSRHRAPDHHADHLVDRQPVDGPGRDDLPVLHHGHPVGDAQNLFEPVRNVDDADALGTQPRDDLMQPLGVLRREHRRRLVEDDDLDLARQRLGDLDHLLMRDGERAGPQRGIDVETERGDQFGSAPPERAPGNNRSQFAEKDVLRHRQVRRQRQLLMDDGDALGARFPWAPEIDMFAGDADLAAARGHFAPQDPHQGGLAGAVFANQRMHLAGLNLEVHAAQGAHAAEAFRDGREPREFGH